MRNNLGLIIKRSKHRLGRPYLLMTAVYLALIPLANEILAVHSASAATTSTASITVATYNIRGSELDAWDDKRASSIRDYLKTTDIFALQEVRDDSGTWLTDQLKGSYARTSTKSTLVIFWKTALFELVDNGSKVLQIDSNKTTKDIVWAKLKQKSTGTEFYVATAHPSNNNEDDRVTQANKAVEYMNSKLGGAPILYLGDMNTALNTKPDKIIQEAGFSNFYTSAEQKANTDYASFVNGGVWGSAKKGNPIDHMYAKGSITANSIAVRIDRGGSDHFPVEAKISLGSTFALTVGTYNILGYYHGEPGGKYATDRLAQIVKNINDMQYDVVGLQEYRDQTSGNAKALEDKLKGLNSAWTMSYSDKAMGSGFDDDQLNIVYNSSTVRLVEDASIKTISSRVSPCDDGGTGVARIARFVSVASGQEFLFINVHPSPNHDSSKCDDERLDVIKGVLANDTVANYTGPLFLVGDFNANPTGDRKNEGNVDRYLKSVGYGNARDIPAAVRKKGGVIDHVYYKKSSVADPTAFEVMDCKNIDPANPVNYTAATTCASDHYPVKAVFGTGNSNCGDDSDPATTSNDYRARNNQLLTGSSAVCCATTVSSSSLTGETNAEKAFNFLTSTSIATNGGKPLNAAQAAGIVGNLMDETGGGTYDLKPDTVNSIGAAGIVQWYKGRRTALNAFAAKHGTDWTDLKTQLEFLVTELESDGYNKTVMVGKGGGKDIDKGLVNVTDASEAGAMTAANIIARYYEIPSIADDYPSRKENAVKAFKDFSNGSNGDTTTATTSSCSQEQTEGDISVKVKEFAWEDGRRGAEQKGGSEGLYATAVKNSQYGNDSDHNYGNDCGAFVYILMTASGFESEYPGTNTDGQHTWLENNWDPVKFTSGKVDVAELRPGDVAWKTGHVFVWIGKVEGFAGKSAEAALRSNTAPTAILSSNTYSDPSLYTWFRKKAN